MRRDGFLQYGTAQLGTRRKGQRKYSVDATISGVGLSVLLYVGITTRCAHVTVYTVGQRHVAHSPKLRRLIVASNNKA